MFESILQHWPFIVAALVLSSAGKVAKKLFTVEAVKRGRKLGIKIKGLRFTLGDLLWLLRKTMPLHPVVAAGVFAFFVELPVSPGVEGLWGRVLYYVGAGVLSTHIYNIMKSLLKKKGVELAPDA